MKIITVGWIFIYIAKIDQSILNKIHMKTLASNIDVCPSDPMAATPRHSCVSLGGVSHVGLARAFIITVFVYIHVSICMYIIYNICTYIYIYIHEKYYNNGR